MKKERAAISTRIISGTAQVIFRTTPVVGQAIGKAVQASENTKQLFGMSFPLQFLGANSWPLMELIFVAAFATPDTRSILGNFLVTNEAIFRQGLMCGILSAGWPLLQDNKQQASIDYVGTKRIDGRLLQELRHTARVKSDLKISLYFEPETFRHVRTVCERTGPAPMGRVEYSNYRSVKAATKWSKSTLCSSLKPKSAPHLHRQTFRRHHLSRRVDDQADKLRVQPKDRFVCF